MARPKRRNRLRNIQITGWSALSLLLTTLAMFAAWGASPHPTDRAVLMEVYQRADLQVTTTDDLLVLRPAAASGPLTGEVLVFVPGARVDPHAYAGRFADFVAESGMTVAIPRPWLNLALLDPRGLDEMVSLQADERIVAVGGHSMGGVSACQKAPDTPATTVVLFAGYCAEGSTPEELSVLSVWGSNDRLITEEDRQEGLSRLPSDAVSITIEGATHALFGDYGPQAGDGNPEISAEDMTALLTEALTEFLAN